MMPTMAIRATTPAIMPPRRVGEMPREVSAPVRLAELEDEVLEELLLLLELGEEVEVEDEPEVPFGGVSQCYEVDCAVFPSFFNGALERLKGWGESVLRFTCACS